MISDQAAGLLVTGAALVFGSAAMGMIFRAFQQPIRKFEIARGWPDYSRGWYGILILLGVLGVVLLAVGVVVAIIA